MQNWSLRFMVSKKKSLNGCQKCHSMIIISFLIQVYCPLNVLSTVKFRFPWCSIWGSKWLVTLQDILDELRSRRSVNVIISSNLKLQHLDFRFNTKLFVWSFCRPTFQANLHHPRTPLKTRASLKFAAFIVASWSVSVTLINKNIFLLMWRFNLRRLYTVYAYI